jgi:hypothetical protein
MKALNNKMNVITVCNEIFNKIKSTSNYWEIDFYDNLHKQFNKHMNNYSINKNSKLTNSKVFFILQLKLKKELETLYTEYLESLMISDDIEISQMKPEEIKKEAHEYIKFKYNQLKQKDLKYNLLERIEQKYNITNKDELNIRYVSML